MASGLDAQQTVPVLTGSVLRSPGLLLLCRPSQVKISGSFPGSWTVPRRRRAWDSGCWGRGRFP